MLDVQVLGTDSDRGGIDRRTFVRVGALCIAGLSMSAALARKATGKEPSGKAKSVIQLWMSGGPAHLDTFDPKPEMGEDYAGQFRHPVETNVSGIRIGELLPLMAKQADKYAILRGTTHSNDGHETATYIVQTGTLPSADLSYPSVGAVVAYKKGYESGYKGLLPPYVVATQPLGRFSEEGFLGTPYKAFATGGDPTSDDFRVGGLVPPKGVSPERIGERRALLAALDSVGGASDEEFKKVGAFQKQAFDLILGDARAAFQLSQEPKNLRERYGNNRFGQSCLLARRLVENGVPFITVNYPGWDTHVDHFTKMKQMLPILDQGFSALLEDLSQRGLLDSTIVLWQGEFGRTPKVVTAAPWNGGRHHYGKCFSTIVAGGGFRGGQVVGATDNKGESIKDRPIYPWDISASMYELLGIDPHGHLPHPQGCVAYVTPQGSNGMKSGGLLKEIMPGGA